MPLQVGLEREQGRDGTTVILNRADIWACLYGWAFWRGVWMQPPQPDAPSTSIQTLQNLPPHLLLPPAIAPARTVATSPTKADNPKRRETAAQSG